jgi:hypothetical protein
LEHSTLISLIGLGLSLLFATVAVTFAYGKMAQKVVAMEKVASTLAEDIKQETATTAEAIRRETIIAADTLKRENDKVITYLNSAITEVKADCVRLREGCQTENCSRMDAIAHTLSDGFRELREDRKADALKFEKIAAHVGRVDEYIRTHGGRGE